MNATILTEQQVNDSLRYELDDFEFGDVLTCGDHFWIPGRMRHYGDHACPVCGTLDTGRVHPDSL